MLLGVCSTESENPGVVFPFADKDEAREWVEGCLASIPMTPPVGTHFFILSGSEVERL